MRELSVRCDALTERGSQCRKPAYESMPVGDGDRMWLCTVHRRLVDRLKGQVWAVRDGVGRVVLFEGRSS